MGSLLQILFLIIDLVWWVIIAQVILSWLIAFNVLSYSHPVVAQISSALERLTAPMLDPIRRRLPSMGGIDISPLVLLLLLSFLKIILVNNAGYLM